MGRSPRVDIGDHVYHIINRANSRTKIFYTDADFKLFESILTEAVTRYDMRLVAYCLMPNHWHLVVFPEKDGTIQKFMQWITLTHTQRVHSKEKTTGYGHIYQGRYKSFLVESDAYLFTLLQYVEQNPLRAKLVKKLGDWKWSSYHRRNFGTVEENKMLATNAVSWPSGYEKTVHQLLNTDVVHTVRKSVDRGIPYGKVNWVEKMIKKFGLETTVKARGRPKKGT